MISQFSQFCPDLSGRANLLLRSFRRCFWNFRQMRAWPTPTLPSLQRDLFPRTKSNWSHFGPGWGWAMVSRTFEIIWICLDFVWINRGFRISKVFKRLKEPHVFGRATSNPTVVYSVHYCMILHENWAWNIWKMAMPCDTGTIGFPTK